MKIEMIVTGVEQNAKGLRQLRREIPMEAADEAHASSGVLRSALTMYPAQPEGTNYQRTYNYERGVDVDPKATNYGATIEATQAAPYSIYLRGDLSGRGPAWMHRGRWDSLVAILEAFLNRFVNNLIRRLERLIAQVMR
jgi:hypothetical protein